MYMYVYTHAINACIQKYLLLKYTDNALTLVINCQVMSDQKLDWSDIMPDPRRKIIILTDNSTYMADLEVKLSQDGRQTDLNGKRKIQNTKVPS